MAAITRSIIEKHLSCNTTYSINFENVEDLQTKISKQVFHVLQKHISEGVFSIIGDIILSVMPYKTYNLYQTLLNNLHITSEKALAALDNAKNIYVQDVTERVQWLVMETENNTGRKEIALMGVPFKKGGKEALLFLPYFKVGKGDLEKLQGLECLSNVTLVPSKTNIEVKGNELILSNHCKMWHKKVNMRKLISYTIPEQVPVISLLHELSPFALKENLTNGKFTTFVSKPVAKYIRNYKKHDTNIAINIDTLSLEQLEGLNFAYLMTEKNFTFTSENKCLELYLKDCNKVGKITNDLLLSLLGFKYLNGSASLIFLICKDIFKDHIAVGINQLNKLNVSPSVFFQISMDISRTRKRREKRKSDSSACKQKKVMKSAPIKVRRIEIEAEPEEQLKKKKSPDLRTDMIQNMLSAISDDITTPVTSSVPVMTPVTSTLSKDVYTSEQSEITESEESDASLHDSEDEANKEEDYYFD